MKERTVVVDGFSKKYAMTGFRLAWSAAPLEVTTVMTKLLENVLSSVNEGVQWGGVAALTRKPGLRGRNEVPVSPSPGADCQGTQ